MSDPISTFPFSRSFPFDGTAFATVRRWGFSYKCSASGLRRLEYDAHAGVQRAGDAPEHTQGVAFVAGRFQAADLLLRSFEQLCELLLGKPGLFAQRGDLQRDIPRLARVLKAGGKRRVLQLLFEVTVEIGFFHRLALYPLRPQRLRGESSVEVGPFIVQLFYPSHASVPEQ